VRVAQGGARRRVLSGVSLGISTAEHGARDLRRRRSSLRRRSPQPLPPGRAAGIRGCSSASSAFAASACAADSRRCGRSGFRLTRDSRGSSSRRAAYTCPGDVRRCDAHHPSNCRWCSRLQPRQRAQRSASAKSDTRRLDWRRPFGDPASSATCWSMQEQTIPSTTTRCFSARAASASSRRIRLAEWIPPRFARRVLARQRLSRSDSGPKQPE